MIILISLAIPGILIAFWAWMLRDMLRNDDIPGYEPAGFHWPPVAKNQWIVFFVILNIFTAGYYYLTVYRQR